MFEDQQKLDLVLEQIELIEDFDKIHVEKMSGKIEIELSEA